MDACLSLHCVIVWCSSCSATPPRAIPMQLRLSTPTFAAHTVEEGILRALQFTTVAVGFDGMPKNVRKELCTSQQATGPHQCPSPCSPGTLRGLSLALGQMHLRQPTCSDLSAVLPHGVPAQGGRALHGAREATAHRRPVLRAWSVTTVREQAMTRQDAPAQRGLRHTEYSHARQT